MTLREHLDQFYYTYNIPAKGGFYDKTFEIPFPLFTLTLPNFSWRKKMLYIHDLEHVLNEQDTTWKGEMFIASWEISTGFYKNFPIIIFPLWTMGWGLWKHPTSVLRGFLKGSTSCGIVNLNIEQEKLLELNLSQLQTLTKANSRKRFNLLFYFKFLGWGLISQFIFFLPAIILIITLAVI